MNGFMQFDELNAKFPNIKQVLPDFQYNEGKFIAFDPSRLEALSKAMIRKNTVGVKVRFPENENRPMIVTTCVDWELQQAVIMPFISTKFK